MNYIGALFSCYQKLSKSSVYGACTSVFVGTCFCTFYINANAIGTDTHTCLIVNKAFAGLNSHPLFLAIFDAMSKFRKFYKTYNTKCSIIKLKKNYIKTKHQPPQMRRDNKHIRGRVARLRERGGVRVRRAAGGRGVPRRAHAPARRAHRDDRLPVLRARVQRASGEAPRGGGAGRGGAGAAPRSRQAPRQAAQGQDGSARRVFRVMCHFCRFVLFFGCIA